MFFATKDIKMLYSIKYLLFYCCQDNDVCSAAEWLFSGSDIDSTESPRTRARHAREAHAKLALHAPLDLIPEGMKDGLYLSVLSNSSMDGFISFYLNPFK